MAKWLNLALVLGLVLVGPFRLYAEDSAPGDWTAPEVEEFGDWSVTCDNVKSCTAIGLSRAFQARIESTDAGDYAMPYLRAVRAAGPKSPPRIFVDHNVWGENFAPSGLTLHVLYDDDPERTGVAYRLKRVSASLDELDPRDVKPFLIESKKTMRAATRMANGDMHGIASTGGMTAALLYIDESQGRRGNVTAFYARGTNPALDVPSAKPLPQIKPIKGSGPSQSGSNEILDATRDALCKVGDAGATPDAMAMRLKNGDMLWSIACGDGSHNFWTLWMVERKNGKQALFTLPRPEQGRTALPPVIPNSFFDPETGRLHALHKYSSNGDCGWERAWAWTGEAFEMVTAREMPACLGQLPPSWLVTYRARTR